MDHKPVDTLSALNRDGNPSEDEGATWPPGGYEISVPR